MGMGVLFWTTSTISAPPSLGEPASAGEGSGTSSSFLFSSVDWFQQTGTIWKHPKSKHPATAAIAAAATQIVGFDKWISPSSSPATDSGASRVAKEGEAEGALLVGLTVGCEVGTGVAS